MSRKIFLIAILFTLGLILHAPRSDGGLKDFFKSLGGEEKASEPSEGRVIKGLKEALEIGTKKAVASVSQRDGYFKNSKIKIPLPGKVAKAGKLLRKVGYGDRVDEFEESMNRAAEKAAPQARALFVDAVKDMDISDAKKILGGRDNEATLYFKDKTYGKLHEIFTPIIHESLSKVGATEKYQALDAKVRTIPFGDSISVDLDSYVTDRALNGLFFMVAEEERKIRKDPAARVTDLLRDVFK